MGLSTPFEPMSASSLTGRRKEPKRFRWGNEEALEPCPLQTNSIVYYIAFTRRVSEQLTTDIALGIA